MHAKELKLDYLKFYDVADREAAGDIMVRGQFDLERGKKMQLTLLDYFGNPVMKDGEPLYNKHAHLAWYRGVGPIEPLREVTLENSFGKFTVKAGKAQGLLVPTEKVERGSAFPKEFDHYKVYRLLDSELSLDKEVALEDQFGSERTTILSPRYLAVPVSKRHGRKIQHIYNEHAHLLLFDIKTSVFEKKIKIRNQFAPKIGIAVKLMYSLMLAVPSIKREWKEI